MDSGYSTDILTVLQGLEELTVPQHERVLVGHEHLEGIHSFLSHQLLHLSAHLEDVSVHVRSVDIHILRRETLKKHDWKAWSRVSETVPEYLGSPPSDSYMQSVVTAGFGVRGEAVLLIGFQQRLISLWQNVSDHHCGPSS